MIQDEAKDSIPSGANLPGENIPRGIGSEHPGSAAAMQDAMKQRGGFRDTLKTGVMGAAAGINAAEGSLSPMAALIQGMSAGMQIPAMIAQQKQKELNDTISASPWAVAYPEMYQDWISAHPGQEFLGGLPAGMVMPVIAAAAQEGAKAHSQGIEDRKTQEEKLKFEHLAKAAQSGVIPAEKQVQFAQDFKKSPEVINYDKIDNEYNIIKSMPNDMVGHTAILAKYIQMLSPTARLNEGTMEVTDPSGTIDKWTKDLAAKLKGQGLMGVAERAKIENVAAIMHARAQEKYANYKGAYLENLKDTDFNPGLIGEGPKTFTKDGQTIRGYIVGGDIVPIE